ncbi:MAG: prolipoprotein diacylglyceryl transferase [Kiritimatiellae bacterium]|nr:prolipoprotein diacylglyceryl transferase [Kiritimatiellia bacterium]
MHPDLIDFGVFHLKTYGAMMALGFIAAWQMCAWLCKRDGRNVEALSNLLILMMAGGIVGARIAYVIEHWQTEFAGNLAEIVRIDKGGLMFYGGLIADAILFCGWCAAKKENPLDMGDLVCTVLPLGHAFGRVGCFFYGCCYGKVSANACAVRFPRLSPAWYEHYNQGLVGYNAGESLPVLPTQLFEAAAMLVLFAVLLAVYLKVRKRFAKGFVAGTYLVLYAAWRCVNEVLRGDPRATVGGILTIGQTISLAMAAIGLALVARAAVKRRSPK